MPCYTGDEYTILTNAFNRLLHRVIVSHTEWVIRKWVKFLQRNFFDCVCHNASCPLK